MAKIVVFDACGLELLQPLFGEERYEVIYTRGEKLYITPSLVWSTLINLFRVRHPFVAYVLTLIQYSRPSIVITYIDNNGYFGKVSQHYASSRFLAIQNGMRCLVRDKLDGSQPICIPEFACFGVYEVDMYTEHNAQVGKFYPIGSLRNSYYKKFYANRMPSIRYDLCLVSEAEESLQEYYPDIEAAIMKLATYLSTFCHKTGSSICIAARSHPDQDMHSYQYELQWYRKYMGEQVNVIPNLRSEFSTYHLIDSSAVSLSFYSTALVEAFGRGQKTLFCNFSNNEIYDLPVNGIWNLGNCSYAEFEERLISLMEMNGDDFQKQSSHAGSYLMKYEQAKPTDAFLKNLIAEAVSQ